MASGPVWPRAMAARFSICVARSAGSAFLPDLPCTPEDRAGRFPPACRVRTPAEYQRVFSGADFRVSNDGFTVLARRNSLGCARMGMAVSRKVSKRAVVRNQIKREIRELFRTWPIRYELSLDMVIIAKPAVAGCERNQRRESLMRLFTKLSARFTISPSETTLRVD